MSDAEGKEIGGALRDGIDREASHWFVCLEDAPEDHALKTAFETWLAADARHKTAWEETLAATRLIGAARPSGDKKVFQIGARQQRAKPAGRGWPTWIGAAAAASALVVAMPGLVTYWQADQATGTGDVRTIALADGSKVVLAPQSAIAIDLQAGERTVRLLRGEAWFDVAHDGSRPFKVLAGASQTRVLGTAFDVRLTDEGAGVAVGRGLVEVTLPEAKTGFRRSLAKGQSLDIDRSGVGTIHPVRPDRIAAWRDGLAVVNDRPVSEVIEALRPWYGGYIVARGPALDQLRVTGLYDLRDPDAALAALGRAHDINVRKLTPWLRIVTVR